MEQVVAINCKSPGTPVALTAVDYEGYTADWQTGQYDFEHDTYGRISAGPQLDKHLRGLSREDLIQYAQTQDARIEQLKHQLTAV
jgi:hypothetical protein